MNGTRSWKKKAADVGQTVVYVDESALYLLPHRGRTWAPCGQPPTLKQPLTRAHLSIISGVTAAGRLFAHVQEDAFTGPTVVAFLRQLLRQLAGPVLVVWDGASIHRCQAVKEFLAQGAAARLRLERLPAYAPELNPDEGVWNLLKRRELKNRCCQDLEELRGEVHLAIRRLQRRPNLLKTCFSHCGYH